jgi:hypothetical protein
MIAGAGSAFQESFNVPIWLGALIMTVVIYGTLLLDFNKIVRALGIIRAPNQMGTLKLSWKADPAPAIIVTAIPNKKNTRM